MENLKTKSSLMTKKKDELVDHIIDLRSANQSLGTNLENALNDLEKEKAKYKSATILNIILSITIAGFLAAIMLLG